MSEIPALIITPHSSGFVPYDILAAMLGEAVHDPEACAHRLEYLFFEGDPYTDALFYMPGAVHIGGLVSRFVVDLNRARGASGLNGVIKLTDFSGRALYPPDFSFPDGEAEARLERYYDPFHTSLDRAMARDDILFFIDGHSMTSYGPVIGPDQGEPRPAFCLITGGDPSGNPLTPNDPTSIPAATARQVVALLEAHFGDLVAATPEVPDAYWINDPFAKGGTNARLSHPVNPHAKPGFALEFNRALYLRPTDDGGEEAIPGRLEALNGRFQAFVADLVPLFEALSVNA